MQIWALWRKLRHNSVKPATQWRLLVSSTLQDLESFTQFAHQKLSQSESTLSLEECIQLWRQQNERQGVLDDIQQGLADVRAGLAQPLPAAIDDVRRQLGIVR